MTRASAEHEASSPKAGPDPWAEAVAEAARHASAVLKAKPQVPHYPLVVNPHVQAFIERYTSTRRDVVNLWLNRSGRYLEMIQDTLRDHGLPEELAFVAMIESGFNPLAVSRAGAKGLWQFMAGTARRYGLRVDHWVDERFDPEKSTTAAARYFRDLYAQFGSWALAKAAYNAGEMKVASAIKAVGSSDFWALARTRFLRQETREFVPAIHAATVIALDPTRYGFSPPEPAPIENDTVAVPPGTKLQALAAASGVSMDTLRKLNPVLVRGTTPPGGPYQLKVPAGSAGAVRTALVPRSRPAAAGKAHARRPAVAATGPSRGVHIVQPRDTVTSIARQYGVKVADVLRWNDLDERARIRPGDQLRVTGLRLAAKGSGPAGGR